MPQCTNYPLAHWAVATQNPTHFASRSFSGSIRTSNLYEDTARDTAASIHSTPITGTSTKAVALGQIATTYRSASNAESQLRRIDASIQRQPQPNVREPH
jgi:hypothetical protein